VRSRSADVARDEMISVEPSTGPDRPFTRTDSVGVDHGAGVADRLCFVSEGGPTAGKSSQLKPVHERCIPIVSPVKLMPCTESP